MLSLLGAGVLLLLALNAALRRIRPPTSGRARSLTLASPTLKVAVFSAAIGACLGLLRLFATFDAPNVLGLDTAAELAGWALVVSPPVIVGLAARTRLAVIAVAVVEAGSPTLLLPAMYDDNADLAFSAFWWWLWLPMAAGVVVVVDRWRLARGAAASSGGPGPG